MICQCTSLLGHSVSVPNGEGLSFGQVHTKLRAGSLLLCCLSHHTETINIASKKIPSTSGKLFQTIPLQTQAGSSAARRSPSFCSSVWATLSIRAAPSFCQATHAHMLRQSLKKDSGRVFFIQLSQLFSPSRQLSPARQAKQCCLICCTTRHSATKIPRRQSIDKCRTGQLANQSGSLSTKGLINSSVFVY